MKRKTFVIAEIGVNHNGDVGKAREMIDAALEARVDAVKFQTFKVGDLLTQVAPKARYQRLRTSDDETQYSMLEKLQLSPDHHHQLYSYCSDKGIEFMSTAFDISSLSFLVEELAIQRLKIASGEIINGPFLLAHAQTGLDIILSTGMASLSEIHQALAVLACGYLGINDPHTCDLIELIDSAVGRDVLKDKVTLLQCTTQYPAPIGESNIRAIMGLRDEFNIDVGYSDHTLGVTASVVAVAFGATIIEKHLTLDKTLIGPDHAASLEPEEFINLVNAIEDVELCIGKELKEVQSSEIENIAVVRKSIVAARKIEGGEEFSRENLAIKRPGSGLSPMKFWSILGSKSTRAYEEGDLID